ncbi:MAG: response regulator [Bacteroidetes bacterium]|nr:response regulator [Bacteroidota bacterium]
MYRDKTSYSILVVEDNIGDYILVEEYLEESMLEPRIHRVLNFGQAREALISNTPTYDAILLDLSLPDKNGEPLVNEIREVAPAIPVIILTGYADVSFAVRSLALGISDYLIKDNLNPAMLHKSIVYAIERNKVLVSLRASEQRYSHLFHMSPLPMWVYDPETLAFVDVNEAAVNHYGYTFEEFMAMNVAELTKVAGTEREDFLPCPKSSGSDSCLPVGPIRHRKKNGQVIYVELQTNSFSFGNKESVIVLAVDITERLHYIQAIQQQNQRLKEIAWFQSHTVRAPLARMMGMISLIKDEVLTMEEKIEFLTPILDSAHELDQIINEIVEKTDELNL